MAHGTVTPRPEDVLAAAELRTETLSRVIVLAPGINLTVMDDRGEDQGIMVDAEGQFVEIPVTGVLRVGVGQLLHDLSSTP